MWAKIAALRPGAGPPAANHLISAMHSLMTVEARSLSRTNGPLHGHAEWISADEHIGTPLAHLTAQGYPTRGLRAVVAHHTIFDANRAGLPSADQHTLFDIARQAVLGSS